MNATEAQRYAKGLSRAADRGVEVVGVGTAKDGRKVYATTSGSEANRWHLVIVEGAHLVCDCKAAQNGRYCCHRAAVTARITREQAEEAAHAAWAEHLEADAKADRDAWNLANMGGALLDCYQGW